LRSRVVVRSLMFRFHSVLQVKLRKQFEARPLQPTVKEAITNAAKFDQTPTAATKRIVARAAQVEQRTKKRRVTASLVGNSSPPLAAAAAVAGAVAGGAAAAAAAGGAGGAAAAAAAGGAAGLPAAVEIIQVLPEDGGADEGPRGSQAALDMIVFDTAKKLCGDDLAAEDILAESLGAERVCSVGKRSAHSAHCALCSLTLLGTR